MRKRWWAVLVLAALAVSAAAVAATESNFGTHLKGRYEVPFRDTNAQGQASFRVADDGQSIDYKLIASNIDNAFMAHIHMVAPGVDTATNNGGIVVWLYPSTAPVPGPLGSGRHDGVLAEGTITAANLVGALAGHPLSDLLAAIADGRTYVNVHANDGVDGANTGPGDFPGGEVRGQLGD
jgi:CHRD domain